MLFREIPATNWKILVSTCNSMWDSLVKITAFFATQPEFWPQKSPNMKFLKQNFNFQSLIKTEAILGYKVWDLKQGWLTKVKTSKIVTFNILLFLTHNEQKFHPNFLQNMVVKANHQLSETFYFVKISYVLAEFWILSDVSEMCHFQLRQLCIKYCIIVMISKTLWSLTKFHE